MTLQGGAQAPASPDPALFEALIVPHRSLSRAGMRRLCAAICLLVGVSAVRFWMIGAWPVAAFGVVEIGLALFFLRLNTARARASELVLLSESGLRVIRTDARGRRDERTYAASWLNVVLVERAGRVPALMLTARDVREEIAASLGEDEKRDLAGALRDALHGWRNPRFDNPVLRG